MKGEGRVTVMEGKGTDREGDRVPATRFQADDDARHLQARSAPASARYVGQQYIYV